MNRTNSMAEETSRVATPNTRPPYKLRRVSVKTIHQVTPRRRRIVFTGQDLNDFHVNYPAQWIKMFFPAPGTKDLAARVYTILAFDAFLAEMTVDFYLHDKGVASEWAATAEPGQQIEFAGPVGSFQVAEGKDWYLLIADDSALAAMIAIAESLPQEATAYLFVDVAAHEEELSINSCATIHLQWLDRGAGQSLISAIREMHFPPGNAQAWVAGETSSIHAIRRLLVEEKNFSKASIHASGYWKRGEAEHKDPESDY